MYINFSSYVTLFHMIRDIYCWGRPNVMLTRPRGLMLTCERINFLSDLT